MLQTNRGIQGYVIGKPVENSSPLADVPKIEQFARRIAQPVTYQSELRKALATQYAVIILQKQIQALGAVPTTYEEGRSTTTPHQCTERERQVAETGTKSTTWETKSTAHSKVGRNSPCPCGSGLKHKRCCGSHAAPIYNKAA